MKKSTKQQKSSILKKLTTLTLLGTATSTAISIFGAVSAWQYLKYQQHHRRQNLVNNPEIVANRYQGTIHKHNQYVTLTTQSMSYAILDPLGVVEALAKEQNIVNEYYDFDICVVGEVSQKGQFGYLGQMDYQLTITGRCDDSLQYNQVEFNKEKS